MGGYMSYQRMRNRNGLMERKPDDDPDPYWRVPNLPMAEHVSPMLVGDLNRMERDYLGTWPETASHPQREVRDGTGRCLSNEVSEATGVEIEDVKRVLRYVFMEQS